MITRTLTVAAVAAAGLGIAATQAHAAQRFDISGQVNAPNNSGATLRQSGPFSGTPLGAGTRDRDDGGRPRQRRPRELQDVQPARPDLGHR